MTERTGLGVLEVALLKAVQGTGVADGQSWVQTRSVLNFLERTQNLGPAYVAVVARDLGVHWQVRPALLELRGNWGTQHGDPMAEPQYTEFRLTEVGRLALLAEAGETGPLPLRLIHGTVYRGGLAPPFRPQSVLQAVAATVRRPEISETEVLRLLGSPEFPVGGPVHGDLAGLLAGRAARLHLTSRLHQERSAGTGSVIVTSIPPLATVDDIVRSLDQRLRSETPPRRRATDWDNDGIAAVYTCPAAGVQDESERNIRVAVRPAHGVALKDLESWVERTWPVTMDIEARLDEAAHLQVRSWAERCRVNDQGVLRLLRLLEAVEADR